MGIRFCYASISENGSVNGSAGDQNGKEVRIRGEYAFGQCWVIRCKNKRKRLRIASASRRFVNNDNIGYSQNSRLGLSKECDRLGWKISKIREIQRCNTDCSAMACASVNCAYNDKFVPPSLTTTTLPEWFSGWDDFEVIRKKNLKGFKLKKGDIIGKTGHCVVVYEGGVSKY